MPYKSSEDPDQTRPLIPLNPFPYKCLTIIRKQNIAIYFAKFRRHLLKMSTTNLADKKDIPNNTAWFQEQAVLP